jgi:FlaA1/EpsC-like NDP-sugar epimerase
MFRPVRKVLRAITPPAWVRRKPARIPSPRDLLGREPISLDTPELQRFLAGKSVLVTGAGGSIGSEICRQTMRFCPSRLVLVERSEPALFEIDRELRQKWIGARIEPCLGDVTDARRIERIFSEHRPQVVFHAAAHKHVPMLESNPGEAIKNNVLGTKIVAETAQQAGARAFVLISTDKAVNPSSVMGASKRVAEMLVQSLNGGGTRFVAVRFGNVMGSSGSVVPIFQRQIESGGPVTVTHPEMKRYFMTAPEAAQLVMQAGAIGQPGQVMILDMGRPVRILDLAREMVRQAGLVEGRDIEIRITGVRPGEKLHEELSGVEEHLEPTAHPYVHVWRLPRVTLNQAKKMLDLLAPAADGGVEQAVFALRQCVPEYKADSTHAPPTDSAPLRIVLPEEAAA